jgi:hypothetical protein
MQPDEWRPDDMHQRLIERQLLARPNLTASAGHRDRVLSAVRDVLAERGDRPALAARGLRAGESAVLAAMAAAAMVAVVAPWLVMPSPTVAVSAEPRIIAQARAAGVDLPAELIATTGSLLPSGLVIDAEKRQPPQAYRAWQLRNLMHGDL